MENLGCECPCSDWAVHATRLLQELVDATAPMARRAGEILSELRSMAEAVDTLVPTIAERSVAIELLRVRHALSRRLDVWQLMPELFAQEIRAGVPEKSAAARLSAAIDGLGELTKLAG